MAAQANSLLSSLTFPQKVVAVSSAVVVTLSTFALVLLSNCAPRSAESCVASCLRFVKGKKVKKVKLPNKASDDASLEEKSLLELNATEVVPGLFLGGTPSSCKILLNHGIRSVLSVVEPHEIEHLSGQDSLTASGIEHKLVPVPDYFAPSMAELQSCVDFVEKARARGDNGKKSSVLVHCASGKGRSACVVLAYLIRAEGLSLASAYEMVKSKRPIVTNLVDWRHRNLSPQGIVLSRFATREVAGGAKE